MVKKILYAIQTILAPALYYFTFGGVVIADVLDCVPNNLLVVYIGPGGDLPCQQDHPRLSNSL